MRILLPCACKGRERRIMKVFKSILLISMALLTFTVVIYDNRVFFNPPKALHIRVWGYGEYKEEHLESWDTVVNIINHSLKEEILWHINNSIQAEEEILGMRMGERVYIFNNPNLEEFFGKYHVSSWCFTCALEMSPHFIDEDTYYLVVVGYSEVRLSLLEHYLAWIVSIATVILWILTVSSVQKLKKRSENWKYPRKLSYFF
jgi:hypothetical protein